METEKDLEKKAEQKSERFFKNYGATKKSLYAFFSIIAAIALIIVLSFTEAQFDPAKVKTIKYWINFALLCGICIFGMISGQQIGDDMSRNNPKGAFRAAMKRYQDACNKIDEKNLFAYFEEWLEIFRLKKIKSKMIALLQDNGIYQPEVLNLDRNELNNLQKPWRKDWTKTAFAGIYKNNETFFLSYNKEQIKIIKYCLDGKITVNRLPKSFFVNALNQSSRDMWESASRAGQKKSAYMGTNYTYKIILMLAMSFIITGFQIGTDEGASTATAMLTLITRLSQMITSTVWGIFIGYELVKIDIEYFDFKTMIIKQYYDEYEKKLFTPKLIEDKAKEDYEKEMQKKEDLDNGRNDRDNSTTGVGTTVIGTEQAEEKRPERKDDEMPILV